MSKIYVAVAMALVVALVAPMALTAVGVEVTVAAHNPEGGYREGQSGSSRWRQWTVSSNGGTVTEGHGQHCSA